MKTLFAECSLYTYDEYWQEIFSNCGRNKFPKGLSYNKAKRVVYIRQGKLRETIPLPAIPVEVFTTMMTLFRKLGLKSPTDKFQTKLDIVTSQPSLNIMDRDWKNIPRHIKEILFAKFVKKMSNIHNLNLKEKQLMYSFIELHINLKNIVPNDIKYTNNEISSITDIYFNTPTRKFFTAPSNQDQKKIIIMKKPVLRIQNRFLKLLSLYVRE